MKASRHRRSRIPEVIMAGKRIKFNMDEKLAPYEAVLALQCLLLDWNQGASESGSH